MEGVIMENQKELDSVEQVSQIEAQLQTVKPHFEFGGIYDLDDMIIYEALKMYVDNLHTKHLTPNIINEVTTLFAFQRHTTIDAMKRLDKQIQDKVKEITNETNINGNSDKNVVDVPSVVRDNVAATPQVTGEPV